MKRVCAWLLSLALAPAFAADDARLVHGRAADSVGVLRVLDDQGVIVDEASAVLVAAGRLVTRCDAIEGAASLSVVWRGESRPASVTARDIVRNLCLLDAAVPAAAAVARLAQDLPPVGAAVYAIADVAGVGIALSTGVLAAVRSSGTGERIQFSAPIAPGASGGGLFDAQGALIGIIDYAYRDGQNVNFAVPALWIAEIEARASSQRALADVREKVQAVSRSGDWLGIERLAREWIAVFPGDRDAWRWLGLAQWSLQRLIEAEASLEQASTLAEPSDQIVLSLALVQAQQKKYAAARATLLAATARRKESVMLWMALARVQHAAGMRDEARAAYQRVTELNPWSREAQNGLAELAKAAGDMSAVIFAHRQLARIEPMAIRPWLVLAYDYAVNKAPRMASAAVARAEALSADRSGEMLADVLLIKGLVAAAQGRYAEALADYRRSLEHAPARPAYVWSLMGDAWYEVQFHARAAECYREALRLEPSDVHARQWYTVALKDDGRPDEALAALEAMKRENPNDTVVWRQIGLNQQRLGHHAEAAAAFREALKLDPRQARVWAELAMEATRLGDRSEALNAYQRVRGMDAEWSEHAYRGAIRYWEARE